MSLKSILFSDLLNVFGTVKLELLLCKLLTYIKGKSRCGLQVTRSTEIITHMN
jgi:hypothetical protein